MRSGAGKVGKAGPALSSRVAMSYIWLLNLKLNERVSSSVYLSHFRGFLSTCDSQPPLYQTAQISTAPLSSPKMHICALARDPDPWAEGLSEIEGGHRSYDPELSLSHLLTVPPEAE